MLFCLLAGPPAVCLPAADPPCPERSGIPENVFSEPLASTVFPEKYLLRFSRPVCPDLPEKGSFELQAVLGFRDTAVPTVLITEGYGIHYALNPHYREELSDLLQANLIVVEHRYYRESVPKPEDGTGTGFPPGLDARSAAADLHAVREAFRSRYSGPLIVSGTSKGGWNALVYSALYPEDADLTVAYVTPLCREAEDPRPAAYLADSVGTARERRAVRRFQKELFRRRERLLPMLDSLARAEGLTFRQPSAEVYDYLVLQVPFALWQWGIPSGSLPERTDPDRNYFRRLVSVSDPSLFACREDLAPYFLQAARELGHYGYNPAPFRKAGCRQDTDGYIGRMFLPEGIRPSFDPSLYRTICNLLEQGRSRMIFLYGRNDPWTAVRIPDPGRENIRIFTLQDGNHRTRISSFPDPVRSEIIGLLRQWGGQ